MSGIKFIEGDPPEQSGPGNSPNLKILEALSERPEVWAEVIRAPLAKRSTLSNRRKDLVDRATQIGITAEAVVRKDGNDVVIYARVLKP